MSTQKVAFEFVDMPDGGVIVRYAGGALSQKTLGHLYSFLAILIDSDAMYSETHPMRINAKALLQVLKERDVGVTFVGPERGTRH